MKTWLEYERAQASAPTLSQEDEDFEAGQYDDVMARLASEDEDLPEQPQILALVREARRLNVRILPQDSLLEMPYVARMEINAVLDAEEEYLALELANARLRQLHEQSVEQSL